MKEIASGFFRWIGVKLLAFAVQIIGAIIILFGQFNVLFILAGVAVFIGGMAINTITERKEEMQ